MTLLGVTLPSNDWRNSLSGESAALNIVFLDKALPILGHICIHEDRGDGAFCLTKTAINALVGVDVNHVIPLVNTIDRADGHARLILDSNAGLCNYVGHNFFRFLARTSFRTHPYFT